METDDGRSGAWPEGLRPDRGGPFPYAALGALVGLVLVAAYPLQPGLAAPMGVAGLLLLLSSLRPLGESEPLGQTVRALVGAFLVGAVLPQAWWRVWPVYLVAPLVIAVAISAVLGLRPLRSLLAAGRFGRAERLWVLAIAGIAAIGLGGWFVLFDPDVSALRRQVPPWPGIALLGAGLAFSVVNAALEEVIWRGLLLRWMLGFAPASVAVAAQALSFGAAHYAGFPSGIVGVGLASAYGLLLGILALRANGLLAPFVAHVVTDMVIFALLLAR